MSIYTIAISYALICIVLMIINIRLSSKISRYQKDAEVDIYSVAEKCSYKVKNNEMTRSEAIHNILSSFGQDRIYANPVSYFNISFILLDYFMDDRRHSDKMMNRKVLSI